MKRNILLDIDGVLADFYSGFAKYLNDKYGAELNLDEEPPEYNIDEWGPGLSNVNVAEASGKWLGSGGLLTLDPYPGAADFVRKLNDIANVRVVTARIGDWNHDFSDDLRDQIKRDTYLWFKLHKIPLTKELIFAHNKVDLSKENGISILIEDKLSTALEASSEGMHTILVNRGWNQHPERLRVYRAESYRDVINLVEKLSR